MVREQSWPTRRTRPARPGHALHPPRYRLLQAASRIPQRDPEQLSVSFEMACPGCGRVVLVTQTGSAEGPAYRAEEHDCG